MDFVLWKPSKPGEPKWESPWGEGRPGWHIECSAMIKSILGDTIDIHGGGIDLIFPHHENEIAQGEGCSGHDYCHYWMHNNFINMNDEKMSKSLGNVVTARSFMDKYHPEILKYLFLSAHYRSMLSITDDKVIQTIGALNRIYTALEVACETVDLVDAPGQAEPGFTKKLELFDAKIKKALNDDFNTADFISQVFEVVRTFNALGVANKKKRNPVQKGNSEAFLEWMQKYGKMSALFNEAPREFLGKLDSILIDLRQIDLTQVQKLVTKRNEAREQKDWQKADEMRDQLAQLGIELHDGSARGWKVKIND